MKFGDNIGQHRFRQKKGFSNPEFDNEPVPVGFSRWVWDAFWILNHSRPIGYNVGSIPLTEIAAYLDIECIDDPSTRSAFMQIICKLDAVFLDTKSKQSKGTNDAT